MKRPPLNERFWSKVERRKKNECWPWRAAVRRKDEGYGAFWLNGTHHPASRIAWSLTFGDCPDHLKVCHSCDNPSCCNPRHLFIGTHKQNNDDKVNKKRHVFGSRVSTTKLSEDQVREIKGLKPKVRAASGERKKLAIRFGVNACTISDIWSNSSWKHLS